jgi:hypothetical protein
MTPSGKHDHEWPATGDPSHLAQQAIELVACCLDAVSKRPGLPLD